MHNWGLHNLYFPYDDEVSGEVKEGEKVTYMPGQNTRIV
jgi:hypothetical protein